MVGVKMNCDSDNLHDTILNDSKKYNQLGCIEYKLEEIDFFNKERVDRLMEIIKEDEKLKDMVVDIKVLPHHKIWFMLNKSYTETELNHFPLISACIKKLLTENKEFLMDKLGSQDAVRLVFDSIILLCQFVCIK